MNAQKYETQKGEKRKKKAERDTRDLDGKGNDLIAKI
jgi:hypothetical protein